MPARPASAHPEPLWRNPVFRIAVVLVLGAVAWAGIRRLERLNLREQIEFRISEDKVLGPKVRKLKESIENNLLAAQSAETRIARQLAVALYHGTVAKFESGKELHGLPATTVLHLGNPVLLSGEPGKNDNAGSVLVSWKNQLRGLDVPTAGEQWIVAVWRDSNGNNVVHTAERCPLGK
jgi:hypothetical protein